jgi:hypothetical protein
MEGKMEPDGEMAQATLQTALPQRTRRALLALCLLSLGLSGCESQGYWDPEVGKFRIPFGPGTHR